MKPCRHSMPRVGNKSDCHSLSVINAFPPSMSRQAGMSSHTNPFECRCNLGLLYVRKLCISHSPHYRSPRCPPRAPAARMPQWKPRLHLLVLLKSGQVSTRGHAAVPLAVHRNTITTWLRCYRHVGLDALLTLQVPGVLAGQKSVPPAVYEQLQVHLSPPLASPATARYNGGYTTHTAKRIGIKSTTRMQPCSSIPVRWARHYSYVGRKSHRAVRAVSANLTQTRCGLSRMPYNSALNSVNE